MTSAAWVELTRYTLVLIVVPAAIAKIRSPSVFHAAVKQYGIASGSAATGVAVALLLSEVILIASLLYPSSSAAPFILAALLFLAFSVGSARIYRRGDRTPCGCLGNTSLSITAGSAALNALVALAALAAGLGAAIQPTSSQAPLAAAHLLMLIALGMLCSMTYWLAHYAASVLHKTKHELAT